MASSSIKLEVDTGGVVTLLSTAMDSLTSTSSSAVGTAYDNRTGLFFWGDFELSWPTGVTPASSQTVELYILPTIDGTNYMDGSSSVLPSPDCLAGTFKLRNATGAQRVQLPRVALPPHIFKVMVRNLTGVTIPSGGTVKMLAYDEKVG